MKKKFFFSGLALAFVCFGVIFHHSGKGYFGESVVDWGKENVYDPVADAANKLANSLSCVANAGITLADSVVKNVQGKTISLESATVGGKLGVTNAAFTLKVKGKLATVAFDKSINFSTNDLPTDWVEQILKQL